MEQQELTLHRRHFTAIKPHVDVAAGSLSSATHGGLNVPNLLASSLDDDNVRERLLKRHGYEVVVGKVMMMMIPDKWSQEEMLKDWLDFDSFDSLLAPKGFDLARAALIADQRRSSKANKEVMESGNSKGYIGMHCSATKCS